MNNRTIMITVDEQSMGNDWDSVERYCALVQEAVSGEYPNADVTVRPERSTFNGGRVEIDGDWEGYASGGIDGVRAVVKYCMDEIFESGEWIE